MEDSHLAISFEDELDGISFFGVFDGHGGSEVAAFCKQYMPDEISRRLKEQLARGARLSGDCLGEVLTASFHAMDEMLRSPDYERPLLALKQAARPASKGGAGSSSSTEAAGSSSGSETEETAVEEQPKAKPKGVLSLLSNSIESDLAQARDKGSLSREEAKQVMMKMALLRKLESKAPALGHETGAADNVGCTAVCVLLTDDEIVCANAGDSRAILCRDGEPVALSHDHKPNDSVERERIEAAGGRIEEIPVGMRVHYRVNGNLNLSRSIGDLEYKKSPELGHERQMICSTPDIVKVPRRKEDNFVVLACDGVWDVKSNEDVCSFIKEKLHNSSDAEAIIPAVEALLDDCIAEDPKKTNGLGGDNMTCASAIDIPSAEKA